LDLPKGLRKQEKGKGYGTHRGGERKESNGALGERGGEGKGEKGRGRGPKLLVLSRRGESEKGTGGVGVTKENTGRGVSRANTQVMEFTERIRWEEKSKGGIV